MSITPVDIQQQQFKTVWRGYESEEVRVFLDQVGQRMVEMQRQQTEHKTSIEHLERETSVANIDFGPLGQIFKSAWCLDKKALSIPNDGHWTQYTHKLIANQIEIYLSSVGLPR